MKATFDSEGYVTDETLSLISYWYRNNNWEPESFLAFAETAFNKQYGKWEVIDNYDKLSSFNYKNFKALEIATGGWGSNEAVINAMQKAIFWSVFWKASFSGGLFILDLDLIKPAKDEKKILTSVSKGS